MIVTERKTVNIDKLKTNPKNPRTIRDHKFKQLVKSIQDFPEMLGLREVVVDENMIILGGNMRFKACLSAGVKELDIVIFYGLTDAQKDEFIIKDNANYGVWDWDVLANSYESTSLNVWGLNVWQPNILGEVSGDDEDELSVENHTSASEDDLGEENTKEKKKVIQIEFTPEDYMIAHPIYQELKKKKMDIGLILLNKLKELLCK